MSNKKKINEVDNITGFKRGLEAEQILGYTHDKGNLMYLMQWKGIDVVDLVCAKEANIICPQVVVQFYEGRHTWHRTRSNVK